MKRISLPCLSVILTATLSVAVSSPHRAGIVLEEFVYTQADFPSCHAATILELPTGELLCAFFGGTKESDPDVETRLCRKPPGGAWTAPVGIADGVQPDGTRCATGNPVLFQPAGGDVMLFYKVFRPDELWWGEMKTSPDGGRTWSKAKKMPEGLLGPEKNKPVQLSDGVIISPSALNPSSGSGGRRVHVERSTDGGKTWTKIGPLNDGHDFSAAQPTVLTHADGRIQMLMRNRQSDADTKMLETWSSDGGLTWTPLAKTSLPNNHSGLDGVTLKDGRFLIVYNHSTREQPDMGHKGRGVLNVAVSKDGKNWEAALVLDYLDQPGRQFSYPAVIQTADGLVHITYTWHRQRIKHVVLDPRKLVTFPITDGRWPADQIPIVDPTGGENDLSAPTPDTPTE